MEKKLETTIMGLSRVSDLGFRVQGLSGARLSPSIASPRAKS